MSNTLFKPGDKVEVVDNITDHRIKIGDTVTLIRLYEDYYKAKEKNGAIWLVSDEELKSIPKVTVITPRIQNIENLSQQGEQC